MLLTVTWPANRPSTSIAKGYVVPARACRCSRRTSCRNVDGRASPPGGTVASHGTSQAALRCRASRQARASDDASGRSVTSPRVQADRPAAAQWSLPTTCSTACTSTGAQHGEAVLHPAARAGQVDDQAAADHARPGRGTAPRSGRPCATPYARIASAMPGTSKSSSGRVTSGVRSVGVRPVPPVVSTTRAPPSTAARDRGADRLAVGYDDGRVDVEAELGQELDEQRAGGVLVDAGGGAVGGHDHGAEQRPRSSRPVPGLAAGLGLDPDVGDHRAPCRPP